MNTNPHHSPFDAEATSPQEASGLRHLAGGEDVELAEMIAEVQEHNARRVRMSSTRRIQVKPANGETRHLVVRQAAASKPRGSRTSDGEADQAALTRFIELLERLRGSEAPAPPDDVPADPVQDALRARLVEHGRAGCSVTGIRITHVRVQQEKNAPAQVCPPVIEPRALTQSPHEAGGTTPAPEGDFAGAFALEPGLLASSPSLTLTVRNILGRRRPIVPVYVELEVLAGLGGSASAQRRLRAPSGLFVYAEDLEPGDACDLRVDSTGLLDRLPCPPGLIQEARLLLWLPRPAEHPLPQPHESATRPLRIVA